MLHFYLLEEKAGTQCYLAVKESAQSHTSSGFEAQNGGSRTMQRWLAASFVLLYALTPRLQQRLIWQHHLFSNHFSNSRHRFFSHHTTEPNGLLSCDWRYCNSKAFGSFYNRCSSAEDSEVLLSINDSVAAALAPFQRLLFSISCLRFDIDFQLF